mmetsp:Transcript_14824/g.47252  ORF Transcript_14824/g.47252 Transcript_14824/m.47252 type:complete len:253 (-) Transcript_14824:315-1073(-)
MRVWPTFARGWPGRTRRTRGWARTCRLRTAGWRRRPRGTQTAHRRRRRRGWRTCCARGWTAVQRRARAICPGRWRRQRGAARAPSAVPGDHKSTCCCWSSAACCRVPAEPRSGCCCLTDASRWYYLNTSRGCAMGWWTGCRPRCWTSCCWHAGVRCRKRGCLPRTLPVRRRQLSPPPRTHCGVHLTCGAPCGSWSACWCSCSKWHAGCTRQTRRVQQHATTMHHLPRLSSHLHTSSTTIIPATRTAHKCPRS